jgi:hypothetical protein
MKKTLAALAVSFSLGLAASAIAATRGSEAPVAPVENSCKAAGHACDKAEDCCSRMCRKDNGKCA